MSYCLKGNMLFIDTLELKFHEIANIKHYMDINNILKINIVIVDHVIEPDYK